MGDTGSLVPLAEAMVAAQTGTVALTGAGVSAPSGIPDFRSPGESLPEQAVTEAWEAARACDVFLVVGTSAEVEPAAGLPRVAGEAGAQVWEVNPQAALDGPVHGRIARPAEEALTELAAEIAVRR